MLRYNEIGYKVIGFDIDNTKVTQLNNGESYIEHISSERIHSAIQHNFKATTDFSYITECDVIILCVPTPLNKYREPDISFIVNTMEKIQPFTSFAQAYKILEMA